MTTDRESWAIVSRHFDRLCDLSPDERIRVIRGLDLTAGQRTWLQRLLVAHDDPSGPIDDLAFRDIPGLDLPPEPGFDWRNHRLGPWRTGRRIARGGMSSVYTGFRADGQFEKKVAIKILDAGLFSGRDQSRLQDEIRILARLEHPGIARLIDSGTTQEGNPYLIMEYVDGIPVDRYCDDHDLEIRDRIRLILQTIETLDYAHQRRVIHCDIKPGNVLVDAAGQVRVVDFGIAHLLDSESDGPDGQVFCSPTYAAPERLQGAAPTTAQDVFSLGALLYRLLSGCTIRRTDTTVMSWTGGVVHSGETTIVPPSSMLGTEKAPPDRPASIRAHNLRGDLDAICARALAEDPGHRYPGIAALGEDLRAWLEHRPVRARGGSRLYVLGCAVRRHALASGLALFLVIALVTGASVSLWQAGQVRQEARRATVVKDFIIEIFQGSNPAENQGEDPPASELLRRGAERVRAELADQPRLLAELLHVIGSTQLERGLIDDAAESLDSALNLLSEHPGYSGHAMAMSDRGMIAYEQGRLETSLDWLSRAEAMSRTSDRTEADLIRVRLADIRVVNHEPDLALELTTPLLEELTGAGAAPGHELVYALRVHGAALQLENELESAEHYLRQAESLQLELNPEDIFLAKIRNELGIVYWDMKRLVDAAEVLELSLDQKLEIYGPLHPQTLSTQGNLASIHLAQGKAGLAIKQLQASLDALNTLHDHSAHPETAFTHGLMAWAHYTDMKLPSALRHATSAHTMAVKLDAADSKTLEWVTPLLGLIRLESNADDAAPLLASASRLCQGMETATATPRLQCLARLLTITDKPGGCERVTDPEFPVEVLEELPGRWQQAYRLIGTRCDWDMPELAAPGDSAGENWPEWLQSRLD